MDKETAGTGTGVPAKRGPEDFLQTIRSFSARLVGPPDRDARARRTRPARRRAETPQEQDRQTFRQRNRPMNTRTEFRSTEDRLEAGNGGFTMNRTIASNSALRKLGTSSLALMLALGMAAPAYATIDNTVTVTGTPPGGSATDYDTATEAVDVEDAAPSLTVTKTATFDLGAGTTTAAGAGDNVPGMTTITYTYTVFNGGNIGLDNVTLNDNHAVDADGALTGLAITGVSGGGASTDTGGDAIYDYLAPGDTATWTATYVVTYNDIATGSADADNLLENTVEAEGEYEAPAGTTLTYTSPAVTEEVGLAAPNPSLDVDKVAYLDDYPATHSATGTGTTIADGLTDDVGVGDTIYYTYTVTNNGNLPISSITLADTHNGVPGALTPTFYAFITNNGDGAGNFSTNSGNTITILYPGDSAAFTVSYTVTQDDINNNQ